MLSATRTDAANNTCDKELSAATTGEDAQAKLKRCHFSSSEQIIWTEPLRGTIPLTEKEIAGNMAFGGSHNSAEGVDRLHMVPQFGKRLGISLYIYIYIFVNCVTTPRNIQLGALPGRPG